VFDIGFTELLVVSVVALLVVGPDKLPKLARTVGLWVGKAKHMVSDVKADIDREIRNQEILDIEKARESVEQVQEDLNSSTAGIVGAIEKSAADITEEESESSTMAPDADVTSAESSKVDESTDSASVVAADEAVTEKSKVSS